MEYLSTKGKSYVLSEKDASTLSESITEIRKTLMAEMEGIFDYVITPKRLDIKKLLENIEGLFAPDVYNRMPEIARYDFQEAGKCISFDLPTAAAFHILRGTESVLRHYYYDKVKQKRVDLLWGAIVTDLRKRTKTKTNQTLNNNLDNIKNAFRNPTQHPEKIYDISEVQDLFNLCVDVVNRMIQSIKTIT